MRTLLLLSLFCWFDAALATILQNGQAREDPYPGQAPNIAIHEAWRTYGPDAPEISYKGRWDSQHISWWATPGIKFAFTGDRLAINFGPNTGDGVLVAYRLGGLDWLFSNVTAGSTYQFIGPWTPGMNESSPEDNKEFELRVQITGVSVAEDSQLVTIPPFEKNIEIIGDSLAAGMYATYEGLSGWGYDFAAGLGGVEYTITAYPGICLIDDICTHGPRHGMEKQWFYASDVSPRAHDMYGNNPEKWDFSAQKPADLVVIDLGTNDERNQLPGDEVYSAYIKLVDEVHKVWPDAPIVVMSLWGRFNLEGNTYVQEPLYQTEIENVYEHFKDDGFVHYFDTRGILQHNDLGPEEHPTDFGHLKVASHLMQWVKIELGWDFQATGPEVQHDTQYWNDQSNY